MPTSEGYNHIALFSPVNSSTPRFLTTGDWEVADGILGVDQVGGLMYKAFCFRYTATALTAFLNFLTVTSELRAQRQ